MSDVFLIGAGFSSPARLPTQAQLLSRIFRTKASTISEFGAPEFESAKFDVEDFLQQIFKRDGIEGVTLEDFYTLIDLSILKREPLPPFSWRELFEIRQKLDLCALFVFQRGERNDVGEFYGRVVKQLVRRYGSQLYFISLNWDTLLDDALLDQMRRINYGADVFKLEMRNGIARYSTLASHARIPSLLKLHGSFNWVTCPICRRIFFASEKNVWLVFSGRLTCPACVKNGRLQAAPPEPKLTSLFLTPTMLKQVTGATLTSVWENACHAIQTARRITFLGYSLPMADYEVRHLLRKSLRPGVEVRIVLKRDSKDRTFDDVISRYHAFLGTGKKSVYTEGVERFFASGAERQFRGEKLE